MTKSINKYIQSNALVNALIKGNLKYWVLIGVYWLITILLYQEYVTTFSIGKRFIVLHLAIQYTFLCAPFLLAVVTSPSHIGALFWFLCGIFHAIIPISYIVQIIATNTIAHRVSVAFLINNLPTINVFLPWPLLFGILLLFLAVAAAIAYSLAKISSTKSTSVLLFCPILIVAGLSINAYVNREEGMKKIHWEPVLALMGYAPKN